MKLQECHGILWYKPGMRTNPEVRSKTGESETGPSNVSQNGRKLITGGKKESFYHQILYPSLLCLLIFSMVLFLEGHWFTGEFLNGVEWKLYDWRMRATPHSVHHYPDPAIVIIELDERSYREIPEPMFLWVPKFSRLFSMLHTAGARVVGFDYLFMNTPDEFVIQGIDGFIDRIDEREAAKASMKTLIRTYHPRFDNEFGSVIKDTRAVMATMIEQSNGIYKGSHREIEMFAGQENLASINIISDPDGVMRSATSQWTDTAHTTYPSFPSFLIAGRYLGGESDLCSEGLTRNIPFYGGRAMLINYIGPCHTFPCVSFVDVDRKARESDNGFFEHNFKGRIVLIGSNDLTSHDLHRTPFNPEEPIFPGVEIHANAINTIIHRDFIRKLPVSLEHLLLILLILGCFFIGFRLKVRNGLLLILLCTAGLCAGRVPSFYACEPLDTTCSTVVHCPFCHVVLIHYTASLS